MTELIIENPHKPVELKFEMLGPIFDPGLPIPLTTKSLDSVQGILDRSYLVLANKQRMSALERSNFYLRANYGIQHGSLISTLGLVFTAAQPMLPIISNLGPLGVWEYAQAAFELLKLVYEADKNGEEITITNNGDGSLVNVNTGSQNVVFNGPVFYIAAASLPHYEFLTKQLSPNKVTSFKLAENNGRGIYLNEADKDIFDLPTKVEEKQHQLICEIFEFDKYESTGRLSVFDAQSIPKGEYRFNVIGRQDINEYIEAMLHRQVEVSCLEETVNNPLLGRKVVALQVLNVKN